MAWGYSHGSVLGGSQGHNSLCVPSVQYKHQVEDTKKEKRTRIPYKPNYSLNLWSIMKNCIGKELSKIPMPVSTEAAGGWARGTPEPPFFWFF